MKSWVIKTCLLATVAFVMVDVSVAIYNDVQAARIEIRAYDVVDRENAIRVVANTGGKVQNFLCLITPEGHGYTYDANWVGLTCAELGVEPLVWRFCRGIVNKPILFCVSPNTIIRGVVEDPDPGNMPKARINAL